MPSFTETTYGGHQISCGFAAVVKPFFTDCYRNHMMFMFDLWDPAAVQANWQGTYDAVQKRVNAGGGMPRHVQPERPPPGLPVLDGPGVPALVATAGSGLPCVL